MMVIDTVEGAQTARPYWTSSVRPLIPPNLCPFTMGVVCCCGFVCDSACCSPLRVSFTRSVFCLGRSHPGPWRAGRGPPITRSPPCSIKQSSLIENHRKPSDVVEHLRAQPSFEGGTFASGTSTGRVDDAAGILRRPRMLQFELLELILQFMFGRRYSYLQVGQILPCRAS